MKPQVNGSDGVLAQYTRRGFTFLTVGPIDLAEHRVHCTAVLGGLINEYQIAS